MAHLGMRWSIRDFHQRQDMNAYQDYWSQEQERHWVNDDSRYYGEQFEVGASFAPNQRGFIERNEMEQWGNHWEEPYTEYTEYVNHPAHPYPLPTYEPQRPIRPTCVEILEMYTQQCNKMFPPAPPPIQEPQPLEQFENLLQVVMEQQMDNHAKMDRRLGMLEDAASKLEDAASRHRQETSEGFARIENQLAALASILQMWEQKQSDVDPLEEEIEVKKRKLEQLWSSYEEPPQLHSPALKDDFVEIFKLEACEGRMVKKICIPGSHTRKVTLVDLGIDRWVYLHVEDDIRPKGVT